MFKLRDSHDPVVQQVKTSVQTEHNWTAEKAVDQAISQRQHQEIVRWFQQCKAGLGWAQAPSLWSKATTKERKELVISDVIRLEDRT